MIAWNPRIGSFRRRRREGDPTAAGTSPATPPAAIAIAAALALAGCTDAEEPPTAQPAETVTVTESAEPTPEPSVEPTPLDAGPETEPPATECNASSIPLDTHAASIAPPLPGSSWEVWQTGNLCGTLGYAELSTQRGTGSSPTQLLLYNEGEFLGTGIRCNGLGQVTGSTDDSVMVQYRWPVGNDSNANMSGRANVTFQWNGSSVDMIGSLPQNAIGLPC